MIENELVSAKEELPIVAFETESMEPDGINRVAVIGSGVMGAGIAAQCANAGCEVLLLDIVPEGAKDRDSLANGAIEKMLKSDPEMLMDLSFAERVTSGNVEDDLSRVSECDWVIEVIVEDLNVKRSLYSRLVEHLGPNTIISANTSTLPRSSLIDGIPGDVASRFLITHFFNPPRYLPCLRWSRAKKWMRQWFPGFPSLPTLA
ncbi:MAG TPA: 3-hydroxyacyl-CoA dehydrogenase NAD-binding domain-containing protein [Candidatus Thalassarchaeaceae archaeon]|nr:3-hydroxyacyl-CoA dehydrogenase NAD-binding domain-containing protein [Candidatus Thalassarchaeaceae archaeon]